MAAVHFTPPQLEILAATRYVSNGGVGLVAFPWDLARGAPVAVRARDAAGNITTRGIGFELKPRQFPRDTIDVTNSFLQAKVPELLPQHPPAAPLIEGFLVLNRDQRRQAEEEKRAAG